MKSHAGLKFHFGQHDRYPYRFEFHFASIHVNASKELFEHRSEIFNRNEISNRCRRKNALP